MGYTHYWYREREIPSEKFEKIVKGFQSVTPILKAMGVKLAGGDGLGDPIINNDEIDFNGSRNCGHKKQDLSITWPSDTARFVYNGNGQVVQGSWFAGALLNERICDGDCSHESFALPRIEKYSNPCELPLREITKGKEKGKYFNFCKTAFKPYDFAVNCALIIAKHYLGSKILVQSDGEITQWMDAVFLCQKMLGYGENFKLDRD